LVEEQHMVRVTHVFSLGLAAALSIVLGACSSSSSSGGNGPQGGCNTNPSQCPSGQTCWPADSNLDFQCMQSGHGKVGDACQNIVGQPSCTDGLFCFQPPTPAGATGTCTPYCDPNKDAAAQCPSGTSCTPAQLISSSGSGPTVNICYGTFGGDAGVPPDAASDATPPVDANTPPDAAAD
jgi:hypothetical protein